MLQLDFLEHPAIEDVIIMSVVLEEVRHQNQSAYQRLRTLTAASDRRFFVFSNEHHRCALDVLCFCPTSAAVCQPNCCLPTHVLLQKSQRSDLFSVQAGKHI